MIAFAALLLVAAPARRATIRRRALYELHQMEMGGGLELQPDGHFRYALTYGAVDEEGEGDWTFDGKTVRLTSNPMPKAPSFELVRDDPAPKGELYLTLEDPGFEWRPRTRGDCYRCGDRRASKSRPMTIRPRRSHGQAARSSPLAPRDAGVRSNGRTSSRLSADRGHRLLFRFHAERPRQGAFRQGAAQKGRRRRC